MAHVRFTSHLNRFFPDLGVVEVAGSTVAEAIAELESRHKGLAAYLVDERGALRKHVNIFIGPRAVVDRDALTDRIDADAILSVFQALSGG